MKNYLFLLLSFLIFFSCGDDETPAELILGTWKIQTFEVASCPEEGINQTTVTADDGCLAIFGEQQCISFTFKADDVIEVNVQYDDDDPESFSSTYTIDENGRVTICDDDPDECLVGMLNDDVLTLDTQEDGCPVVLTFIK